MGYAKKDKSEKADDFGQITFRFDYIDPISGKRFRKQIRCRPSAVKSIHNRWQSSLLEGFSGKVKLFEKIDEYLQYIEKDIKGENFKKKEKMYRWKSYVINNFLKVFFHKDTLLKEINKGTVRDFIVWRKTYIPSKFSSANHKEIKAVTDATLNRCLSVFNCFFNYCIERDYCISNPCFKTKLKENNEREIKLSKNQINELVDVALKIDKQFQRVIKIALLSGMRKMEIFTLRWNDVDFKKNLITLSRLNTKSKMQRVIPITHELKDVLLPIKVDENENVISGYTHYMLRDDWSKLLTKFSPGYKENEIKLRFHDLRHLSAQYMLDSGLRLEDVQHILGHADFQTTKKRYAMFAPSDLVEKSLSLNKMFEKETIIN